MPTYDYKQDNHYCIQEARLSAIETKLQNKKENLHEVHEDYYHLRDKLEVISSNVVELTTILKENQKKEELHTSKIDELQLELAKANLEIGKINSSMLTLQYVIGLGVPFACAIITFIVDYML